MKITERILKRIIRTRVYPATCLLSKPRIMLIKSDFNSIASELFAQLSENRTLKKKLVVEKRKRLVKADHLKSAKKIIKKIEWHLSRLESEV